MTRLAQSGLVPQAALYYTNNRNQQELAMKKLIQSIIMSSMTLDSPISLPSPNPFVYRITNYHSIEFLPCTEEQGIDDIQNEPMQRRDIITSQMRS